MKIFFKILFWVFLAFWILLGLTFHVLFFFGLFCSPFNFEDKVLTLVIFILMVLWWVITAGATVESIKTKKAKKKAEEYNKKYISDVEIVNSYFGNGVLVKDSGHAIVCYKDIKSGFDRLFDSFGKKSNSNCDLYEFLVREDNIEYVLASLEEIYKKSDQIMEKCYDKIYKEIIDFFEAAWGSGQGLKKEFDPEYLKENWYVNGLAVYDDGAEFSVGIKAAENPEDDNAYDINISVDYDTQEPEVSFDNVW